MLAPWPFRMFVGGGWLFDITWRECLPTVHLVWRRRVRGGEGAYYRAFALGVDSFPCLFVLLRSFRWLNVVCSFAGFLLFFLASHSLHHHLFLSLSLSHRPRGIPPACDFSFLVIILSSFSITNPKRHDAIMCPCTCLSLSMYGGFPFAFAIVFFY